MVEPWRANHDDAVPATAVKAEIATKARIKRVPIPPLECRRLAPAKFWLTNTPWLT